MTTMELRASLLKEVSVFFDDEEMMRSAIKALKGIRKTVSLEKKKKELEPDSDEYILAGLEEAFKEMKEVKAGRSTTRPVEDVLAELYSNRIDLRKTE